MLFCLISITLSMVLGALLMPRVLVISYKKKLFDIPDGRKVHTAPIPRLGGVTFFPITIISFLSALAICYKLFGYFPGDEYMGLTFLFYAFFIGLTSLYLIGCADDLIGVGYKSKFLVQLVVASLFPFSGLYINNLGGLFGIYELPFWLGSILTVILVVYITNAINLIDGIDGLASGLSLIALVFLASLFYAYGGTLQVIFIGAVVGVLYVFFFYNVFGRAERRQKLFMGDTGSLTLGYTISFLLLFFLKISANFDPWDNGLSVVAMSSLIIPLFDVARVVLTRARDKRNLFLPDKNHIHHKLLRTGLKATAVMVTLLGIALFFIIYNVVLVRLVGLTLVFLIDIATWTLLNVVINYFILRHEHSTGKIWHIAYNDEHKK